MKRRLGLFVCVVLLVLVTLCAFVACDDKQEENAETPQTSLTFTIQYTDDSGTHTISVTSGMPYSLESIPEREGYVFNGLFDAEVGGTQYVSAQGASLAPFSDLKNLVLFPQYSAKEYTLVLDYQGAPVTGVRELNITYGARIQSLPLDLVVENKEFMGWYTEPNCEGVQIADIYGTIPSNAIVTSRIFDLSDPDGFIHIYAGFRGEMHTVTFYFKDGMAPEEVEAEHGTPISEVQSATRVDGQAVLTWSQEANDEDRSAIFYGRVESDLVLYALDYAPVIDFDPNGGESVDSIIARAGDAVTLPDAKRENWSFAGWYTAGGTVYTATTMPQESISLTARWTPMIILDERGGTLVDDIVAEQGSRVSLPDTEKDGYMFAGWYTEQGTQYTDTAMPSVSIKLEARYRKILTDKVVIISETDSVYGSSDNPSMTNGSHTLDVSKYYDSGIRTINITAHYSNYTYYTNKTTGMAWYYQQSASDAFKIWEYSEKHIKNKVWENYTRESTLTLYSPTLYICRYCNGGSNYWINFWLEIEYPDMTTLY